MKLIYKATQPDILTRGRRRWRKPLAAKVFIVVMNLRNNSKDCNRFPCEPGLWTVPSSQSMMAVVQFLQNVATWALPPSI